MIVFNAFAKTLRITQIVTNFQLHGQVLHGMIQGFSKHLFDGPPYCSCRKACRPVKQSESNWDVGSSRLSQVIIGESASGKDNATDFFQRIIKGLQEHNDQSVIDQFIARRTRKTAFFRSSVPPFFTRNGSDLPFSRSFVLWENRKNRVLPFSHSPAQLEGRTHYNKRTTVTTTANRMLLCAYSRHVSSVWGAPRSTVCSLPLLLA